MDEDWEAHGATPMCGPCPDREPHEAACRFWLKGQPCPVEVGMSEVVP